MLVAGSSFDAKHPWNAIGRKAHAVMVAFRNDHPCWALAVSVLSISDALGQGALVRSVYNPGGTFPDCVLPDHTSTERRLSALQRDAPMVVVLVRNSSCHGDLKQLEELTAFQPVLLMEGCRVVAITTDDWHTTRRLRQRLGARYPFLYDTHKTLRDELDIWDFSDPQHVPMIPHTFLLAPSLRIHRVWNGHYYWVGRPPATCTTSCARSRARFNATGTCRARNSSATRKTGGKHSFHRYGTKSIAQLLKEMSGAVDQFAGPAEQ
jgi:peroxiredoxin